MNKFISIYSSRFTQTDKTLKLIELNDSFIKYLRDDQIVELPDELSSSNAVAEKINNDKYELLLNVKSTQEFLLYGILFAVKSTVDLLVFPFNEKNMEYEENNVNFAYDWSDCIRYFGGTIGKQKQFENQEAAGKRK